MNIPTYSTNQHLAISSFGSIMKIESTFHGGSCSKESLSGSGSCGSAETPTQNDSSDPNPPASSPAITCTKKSAIDDDVPALTADTPLSGTAHTQSSEQSNGSDVGVGLDENLTERPTFEELVVTCVGVPPLLKTTSDGGNKSFIPPFRPGPLHRRHRSEGNDSSMHFSSVEAVKTNDAGEKMSSPSTFACFDNFSNDASSHSISSSTASDSSASSVSSSSSSGTDSDSDSSIMSSDSSSSASLISDYSSFSDDIKTSDNGVSGGSSSVFDSLIPSSSNTSSSGVGMKKTSKAWLRRRERMRTKTTATTTKIGRREKMKLRSRDRFLKKLAMKGEADYEYLKGNETRARSIARGTGAAAYPRSRCNEARRHVLFELLYSLPAAATMLAFCCTHVAIYELVQSAVADCLQLNEFANQNLVYICVFAVAVLVARLSGSLYEFTSDDEYDRVKFDMHNKLKLGDFDARILRRVKKHPTVKVLLDLTALYLTYISANHLIMEAMLKTFFDMTEDVTEGLPSMKYPGISSRISSFLLHGERMFEDPSVVLGEQTPAASSTACAILGGDLCDERVFQACSALDEFRANLTVADGEYLYDQVSLVSPVSFAILVLLYVLRNAFLSLTDEFLLSHIILMHHSIARFLSTCITRSSVTHRPVFISMRPQ